MDFKTSNLRPFDKGTDDMVDTIRQILKPSEVPQSEVPEVQKEAEDDDTMVEPEKADDVSSKVDGRSRGYRETVKRIMARRERSKRMRNKGE